MRNASKLTNVILLTIVLVVGAFTSQALAQVASDGTVGSFQKISDTEGGFAGTLDDGDRFGTSVASLGDLDGDSVTDVAVGAIFDDDGDVNNGAVWILFLNTPDTTPPDTTIDTAVDGGGVPVPDGGLTSSLTLTFSGVDDASGVASFECRVDSATFAPCTSPQTPAGLADGPHTFDVSAIDAAGNTDLTPASRAWILDATQPDTTILTAVDGGGVPVAEGGLTTSPEMTLTFSGSDASGVASFECSLNGAMFAACTSPQTLAGLAADEHTFAVSAIDTVGNTDLTPASLGWSVVTPASVAEDLQNIVDNNSGTPLADKVEDALQAMQAASDEFANTSPDNQAAVGNLEGAEGDLEAAVSDGVLDQGQGTALMDQIAAIARQLGGGRHRRGYSSGRGSGSDIQRRGVLSRGRRATDVGCIQGRRCELRGRVGRGRRRATLTRVALRRN